MLTFAIVIPSLNQSRFLRTALKSLRHQKVPYNLAIMDGGSSDGFMDVVQEFSELISFMRSKPDNGQSDAIKESSQEISGDILSWLNADDYYFPDALDKVRKVFEKNPDIDVVYGDAVHVNAKGFFQSYFPPIKHYDKHDLTRNCFICQPACFYRRSLYEKVGGINPHLQYTMDWDLWCRFAIHNATFHYLQEPLAAVRYYPGTKTLSGTKERFKEIYRIEKKYGHRLFRRSVLGAYYYDLTHKKDRSFCENIYFRIFDLLRKAKQRMYAQTLLYGFHRWDPIFEKKCQIHLPWYDDKEWIQLQLNLAPSNTTYHISLNQVPLSPEYNSKGQLIADLPQMDTPHRIFHIESPHSQQCMLLDFNCVLN